MRSFHIDRSDGSDAGLETHTGGAHLHCQFFAALIGLAGVLASRKAASDQAKVAGRAGAQVQKIEDRQIALSEKQDARADEVFREYQQTYKPRQRELVADAFENNLTSPEAAAARATSDVRKATANAEQINARGLRRLGVDPTSGSYAATRRDIEVANAGLEASERGLARREARDSNFGRQLSVVNMGAGLPSTAGNLTGSSAGILGDVNSSVTRRLERAQELGAAAGQQLGGSLAGLGGSLVDMWKGRGSGSDGRVIYDTPVQRPPGSTPPYAPDNRTVYG